MPVKSWKLTTTDMVQIALFAVLIAVCAWISIPSAVPFTLQTFGLFMALGLLGGKKGTWTVVLYLLIGLTGIPVFSGFRGGFGILAGITGGYLIGFLIGALVYWLITAQNPGHPVLMLLGMAAALLVDYTFGTAWFMLFYAQSYGAIGLSAALSMCVIPFLIPDLAKLALAFTLSKTLKGRLPGIR